MNKSSTAVLAAIVALAVSVSFPLLFPQKAKEIATNTLGAIPGTSVDGNYFSIGGVEYYHYKTAIIASSTVPCYVKPNPFGAATTSIEMASMQVNTNGLGAFAIDLSTTTSAGGWATTSPALARSFAFAAAPVRPFIYQQATTTTLLTIGRSVGSINDDGAATNVFVKPGEGLTFRVATGTPGTFTSYATGVCEVVLRKL